MIPFSQQITQIRGGSLDDELTDALAECVRAVDEQGGTASLTLKISVKRSGKTNSGYVKVSADFSKKLPKPESIEAVLFATPDGALWEDNPKQERMFDKAPPQIERKCGQRIVEIMRQAAEPIVVDRATGEVVEVTVNRN